jgi:mRNA interferase MazF
VSSRALDRGDVILTQFPFSDLSGSRVRSAVVVSRGLIADDVVLTAISSVIRGRASSTDYRVGVTHPEFALTGLRVESVMRMYKLACVEQSVIIRRLGHLGPRLQAEADQLLRQVLGI